MEKWAEAFQCQVLLSKTALHVQRRLSLPFRGNPIIPTWPLCSPCLTGLARPLFPSFLLLLLDSEVLGCLFFLAGACGLKNILLFFFYFFFFSFGWVERTSPCDFLRDWLDIVFSNFFPLFFCLCIFSAFTILTLSDSLVSPSHPLLWNDGELYWAKDSVQAAVQGRQCCGWSLHAWASRT